MQTLKVTADRLTHVKYKVVTDRGFGVFYRLKRVERYATERGATHVRVVELGRFPSESQAWAAAERDVMRIA